MHSKPRGGSSALAAFDRRINSPLTHPQPLPAGAIAKELSKNPTVLIVNDTVFVHGGLMPEHVRYGLENINREVGP